MAKPTIQQARDRAEVLWGTTRPEWVTRADSEHVHPLEGGALRLKSRHERRPHLPVEPASLFYPRYFAETAVKAVRWATLAIRLERLARKVKNDPQRLEYMDQALTLLVNEVENLELYKTRSSQAFLDQRRHIEEAQKPKVVAR